MVGIPGVSLTEGLIEHLHLIRAGGVIPFARNFQDQAQFTAWMSSLRGVLGPRALVMIDHEGGVVVRLTSGVTRFPDALTVGRTQQPEAAYQQGQTEATELRACSIDVNLAPCVDVLIEGADPIIGNRSYGSDPACVAAFASARIEGMQRHDLHACAKHFPGIGAVPKDPHKHLPTVEASWEQMRRVHLVPFVAAIRAGVSAIMSSHVCYAGLAEFAGQPATFSPWCMRTLLRDELGFQGVVISDDMEMGALRELCSIGEAAIRAIEAGHDLLLLCSDLSLQREAFEALCGAYRSGRLSVHELDRSLQRLDRLRRKNLPGS